LKEQQEAQEREFAEQQRLQQLREKEAQEALERQLREQQMMGMNQGRIAELEREILGLRGQWERDQMMLERYDAVSHSRSPTLLGTMRLTGRTSLSLAS
jgi:DNA replication protein DnaC